MTTLFLNHKAFIIFNLLFLFSILDFQPGTKLSNDIILKDEPISIIPKEFYVADVIDLRENRTGIAWLVPVTGPKIDQTKLYPVDLHGGGLFAIKQFIDRNLPANKLLRPVIITIKKFTARETVLSSRLVEGRVDLNLSFELENDDGVNLHLANYNRSAVYNRTAGSPQDIEPTLRRLLIYGLLYLNNWMNLQSDNNVKLAKGVKIIFVNYNEKQEGDTIYYSVNRPLKWDDFQSNVPNSRYDAEVFATFGYEEHNEINKGIVIILLSLKVGLPKSACWANDASRNVYTLNHEQRHFDIAELAAQHFKQKILNENLPVNNFDGPINENYLEAYREMNRMQKLYDAETNHGTNQLFQQHWNERIDNELKIKN